MNRFLVWLGATVIRLLAATLRMKIDDHAGIVGKLERTPGIIAFWHNRTALMAFFDERYCPGYTALTFISRSRDGQFMTDVAAKFGIKAVRGSSSRHGTAAALAAIRAASDPKTDLVITPDGPRGPRYQLHPGILRLAQATGRPIYPITYHLGWKWELKSWDRFQIPLPFSTCHLILQSPIFVPENAATAELSEFGVRVTEALGGD